MEGINNLCSPALLINPLSEESVIIALKSLLKTVETSIGPQGGLKIILNCEGGLVSLTSSSVRMFPVLIVQNIFAKIVISSAKSQISTFGDGGLHCAHIALKLLTYRDNEAPLPVVGALLSHLGTLYLECLKESSFKIDLSNLAAIQSLIQSIISSKPGINLKAESRKKIACLLLEGFLKAFPKGNIRLLSYEGCDFKDSQLYTGLILAQDEFDLKCNKEGQLKTALFSCSLSIDSILPIKDLEFEESCNLDSIPMQELMQKLVSCDVIFCQKTIAPNIKKHLQNSKIIVLERLGLENAKYVESVSGGLTNSCLTSNISFGSLTSIGIKNVGKKNFVHLYNENISVLTILICGQNSEALDELKVVCNQTLDTLFRIITNPAVIFGSGCGEMIAAHLLAKKIRNKEKNVLEEISCSRGQFIATLNTFLACLAPSGSRLSHLTDTSYGHLWRCRDGQSPNSDDYCECKFLSAQNIHHWIPVSEAGNIDEVTVKNCPISSNVILDNFSCRENALSVAFETASLLLRTSLCINNLHSDS